VSEPGFGVLGGDRSAAPAFLYQLRVGDAAIQAQLQAPHDLQPNAATAAWIEGKAVRNLQRQRP
jgi:hypothetical protein